MNRPILENGLQSEIFRSFYYLKEELVLFCKQHNLPTSGNKMTLTDRIGYFLDTGKVIIEPQRQINKRRKATILLETIIEHNVVCSEIHRSFFIQQVGSSFSFNVVFQKWLKNNAGKTYQDAVDAYYLILQERKGTKSIIGKQFEYNAYIRDFFNANRGYKLEQAIVCWQYKKSQQGNNSYEHSDLIAINKV